MSQKLSAPSHAENEKKNIIVFNSHILLSAVEVIGLNTVYIALLANRPQNNNRSFGNDQVKIALIEIDDDLVIIQNWARRNKVDHESFIRAIAF